MDAAGMDDSAMPDSTMMDGTIDDLFGETADGLGVSLPQPPLPAGLVVRLAEMQGRGCCTKLAWSATGSIAMIAEDGSKISFRAMVRDKTTRVWTLGEETKTPILPPDGRTFVHIHFNGVGIDLAAVDSLGTVHMYTLTGPLGKMHAAPGALSQEDRARNTSDDVVGMHWLPLWPSDFRAPYINPATKVGDRWEASLRQRDQHSSRAHHPAEGKHALLHVTRSAKITLLYQNDGHAWQSTALDFNPITSSQDLISHAALSEDGADVLLVTYALAGRFRLYRVSINWNPSQQTRPPNMTFTLVSPTLSVSHLGELDGVQAKNADLAGLTHLRILPVVSDSMTHGVPTFPTVLAVFTHASISADAAQPSNSFSVISRWHAEPFTPALHESFKKLKAGADAPIVVKPTVVLRRQPDMITNKVILSIQTQNFDTLVAFGASDGSVDLRDRFTMNSLEPDYGDTTSVSTLSQTGFEHAAGDHHIHVAMSADASGLAYLRVDRKLIAQAMSFRYGWHVVEDGISDNKPFIEAAAVCIARQFALLLYHNITSDETLALVPMDVDSETRSLIVKMIFRMMSRSPDISMQEIQKQQMIVLREPLVPRILSAQLVLGTDPVSGQRNFAAQFAFAVLNLRQTGTALAQTMGRANMTSAEATHSVRGLVRWSTDLTIFIVDTLIHVRQVCRDSSGGTSIKQAFQQLIARSGNPALHLLLCSFSRSLLRFQTLWVGKFFQTLQAVIPNARSVTERHQLDELVQLAGKIPFKLSQFDQIIAELDASVRAAYTRSGLPGDRRSDVEIAMITDGIIPPELEEPVTTLIDTLLPKLCEGMDLDRLYFWQTEWIGLTSSNPAPGRRHTDVIRKLPLLEDVPLRYCRRCGSEMEDLPVEKIRESPPWLAHAQRHCFCMNYWLLA